MTRDELVNTFRLLGEDTAEPYKWDDDFVLMCLADAELEVVKRTFCLQGSMNLTITSGMSTYSYDKSIFRVIAIRGGNLTKPLTRTSKSVQDKLNFSWETEYGLPQFFIPLETSLILVPTPVDSSVYNCDVVLNPTKPIAQSGPVIKEAYHFQMVYWALHLALLTRDADVGSLNKAGTWERKFDNFFGPATSILSVEQEIDELPLDRTEGTFI